MMLSKMKGNQGFILADVTLGIFIISITVLIISMLFTQALQTERIASEYTIATNLAQKQLELLKTKPAVYWATLQLPSAIPWQDANLPPPAAYELQTHAVRCVQEQHLVQVTVTVTWKNKQKSYSMQLVTFYANMN